MKVIELNKGQVAIVDDEDFEKVAQYRWNCGKYGYAYRSHRIDGKKRNILMHVVIMNPPPGFRVDHINLNKLDNRKENLRLCKHWQNMCNKPLRPDNKLGVKGVCKQGSSYRAGIKAAGVFHYLGSFKTLEDAKAAYDAAAVRLHGEFARLN